MNVHVIIPTLGWSEDVTEALASARGAASTIVVVDGPGVAPPENVRTVRCARRGGFASACNAGAAAVLLGAAGDAGALLFLNDDARLPDNFLDAVEDAFADTRIGVVGFRTAGPGGQRHTYPAHQHGALTAHDGPTIDGCAFAIRADVFRKLAGFDESFGMYGEETDLFSRVQAAGLELVELPLEVWHGEEGSTSSLPVRRLWWAMRNPVRHALLNEGPVTVLRRMAGVLVRAFSGRPAQPALIAPHVRRQRSASRAVRIPIAFASLLANVAAAPALLVRRRSLQRGSLARHLPGGGGPAVVA